MVTFVVVVNLLITVVNLYIAWRIWKLRKVISGVTKTLNNLDRKIFNIFHTAPKLVLKGQAGANSVRNRYEKLSLQLQQLQQVLNIFGLVINVWRRQAVPRLRRRSRKRFKKVSRPTV